MHMPQINPYEVYTTEETERLLKISNSTIKRMLKSGLLRANKVGKQYRIMGHELLRIVSPEVEDKLVRTYQKIKSSTKEKTESW
jgi:excisionase family DNA binding protein